MWSLRPDLLQPSLRVHLPDASLRGRGEGRVRGGGHLSPPRFLPIDTGVAPAVQAATGGVGEALVLRPDPNPPPHLARDPAGYIDGGVVRARPPQLRALR